MDLGGSELILKDPAGSRILEPLEGSGRLLQASRIWDWEPSGVLLIVCDVPAGSQGEASKIKYADDST